MGRRFGFFLLMVALIAGAGAAVYWINTIRVKNAFLEAKDILSKGDVAQASALFEKVYTKRPNSTEGFESLANLCQLMSSQDQHEKGITYAREFLHRSVSDQDKARAKYYLGLALTAQGNNAEAAAELSQVVRQFATTDVADDALLQLAKAKEKDGALSEAKELLRTLLERYPDSNLIHAATKDYGRVNVKILFSPLPTTHSMSYTVAQRDTVETIAKKFHTSAEVIKEANGIANNMIRKGQLLKIDKSKHSIVVSKSKNTLTLFSDGELFKVYSVGTGKANSTPTGDYKITNKLANPPWYKPGGGLVPFGDKGNLLGTRWMGINLQGYGIHGTWEPDTVGKQSSAGCVRLLNEEVEELFKIVEPGTPVQIVD